MPFCPNCGREAQNDTNFCPTCGADLSAAPVNPPPLGTPQELPYHLSLNRILLMSVLSYGLYLFYWFYLTWKQYRDHTGNDAYPVWHALTLLVPVYGLFRTHAHARTFRALMWNARLSSSIRPGWAWVAVLIAGFLVSVSLRWAWVAALIAGIVADNVSLLGYMQFAWRGETLGAVIWFLVIDLIVMALIAGLLLHLQSNINRYWNSRPNVRVRPARIGVGEVIFGILGALSWLAAFADIFSESWRMGL